MALSSRYVDHTTHTLKRLFYRLRDAYDYPSRGNIPVHALDAIRAGVDWRSVLAATKRFAMAPFMTLYELTRRRKQ